MRHVLAVLVLLLAGGAPAYAQGELQKLQQLLLERDALIQDLLRRMEALEQKARPAPAATAATGPAPSGSHASPPVASAHDEDAARALERALVREGGLVLPPGIFEIEPRYRYTYDGNRGLAIVPTAAGAQVAQATARRHRNELGLGWRAGLPHGFQLAVSVPYVQVRSSSAAAAAGFDDDDRSSGMGDAEVQVTRQLADERPGRAALLGSLTWKAATGDHTPGQPSPGSGFHGLQASLTAVKRQDPLVFFGGLSYTAYRARTYGANRLDPGNAVGIRIGTLLAASPQSSLRLGLDLTRAGRTRVNGTAAAGTDSVTGLIELGLVSLVNRRTSLDLSVGFGVTPDAPRLRVGVALPVRFD